MEIPFNKKKSQSLSISASSNCYFLFIPFSPHAIRTWCHPFRTLCVRVHVCVHLCIRFFFSGLWDGIPTDDLHMCACWCDSRCMCVTLRFVMLNIFLFRVVYHTAQHTWHPQSKTRIVATNYNVSVWLKRTCRKKSMHFIAFFSSFCQLNVPSFACLKYFQCLSFEFCWKWKYWFC